MGHVQGQEISDCLEMHSNRVCWDLWSAQDLYHGNRKRVHQRILVILLVILRATEFHHD